MENRLEFVLKDVICGTCFNVTDINVFKCTLVSEDFPGKWVCHKCEKPYDMFYVEGKILQYLKDLITQHQVPTAPNRQIQDLYCKKCRMVRDSRFQQLCPCSGQFGLLPDYTDQLKLFQPDLFRALS
jgi:hypothetical protein